jgi:hypothetical protein
MAGYAPAQAELGSLYDRGMGVSRSAVQAARWYQKASRQGNVRAMGNLAWDYEHGQGVPRNISRAVFLYRRAANLGDPRAQNNMGVLYLKGRGVPHDEEKARQWFLKAASNRYAIAQTNLGIMYANGQGVLRNQETARLWFLKAARSGNPVAEEWLGEVTAPEAFPWTRGRDQDAVVRNTPADSPSFKSHPSTIVVSDSKITSLDPSLPHSYPDVDHPSRSGHLRPQDFGVVIGIEHYPSPLPPATYAAHDAHAVVRMMLSMGIPADHIRVLEGDRATRARTRSAITWLNRNVRPDSRVWVYFSGHGTRDEKGRPYLVPYDGDPADLPDTGVGLHSFLGRLGSLPASRIIVALDSCFSGEGQRSVVPEGARPLVLTEEEGSGGEKERAMQGAHLILLSASGVAQEAGVLPAVRHGLFTYYLLRGLEGAAARNGHLTLSGLYGYLGPKVSEQAALQNRDQVPTIHPFPLEGTDNLTLR